MTKAEIVWTLIGLILLALRPLAEKTRDAIILAFASAVCFGIALFLVVR